MTTVTLCKCKNDPRVVSKTTEGDTDRSCKIYGDCSIHNPIILLSYFAGIESYNYAKIGNRMYWIDDIVLRPGKRVELTLKEDVLATHAGEIRNINKFRVMRNEHVGQPKLYDPEYPARVDNNIVLKHFSKHVFNTEQYLVTVLGGAISQG